MHVGPPSGSLDSCDVQALTNGGVGVLWGAPSLDVFCQVVGIVVLYQVVACIALVGSVEGSEELVHDGWDEVVDGLQAALVDSLRPHEALQLNQQRQGFDNIRGKFLHSKLDAAVLTPFCFAPRPPQSPVIHHHDTQQNKQNTRSLVALHFGKPIDGAVLGKVGSGKVSVALPPEVTMQDLDKTVDPLALDSAEHVELRVGG